MMELDNRRMGWIAIGLGVLALFIAISGRADSRPVLQMAWGYDRQQDYVAPQAPPAVQQAPVAPQAPMFRDRWQDRGEWGFSHGHGPWFFMPFFFLGGLLKLLFFGALIALAFRFFRGRGHSPWGRGPGHGPWGHGGPESGGKGEAEQSEPRDPPAEPGASTGSTVKL
jgi:hypothetical protein